jgi:hypothetical protein
MNDNNDQFPKVHVEFPDKPSDFVPPAPLSDFAIQQIHAGLMIPNPEAIRSMAREIRKWRGDPNPDSI